MRWVVTICLVLFVDICRAEEQRYAFERPAAPTDALESLTPEQARTLATQNMYELRLGGLTSLSTDVAVELARVTGWLYLEGLKSIPPDVAKALSGTSSGVVLNGLTSLSPEVAAELAQIRNTIYLDGLKSLSIPSAEALASHRGLLSLAGLTACDDDLVAVLCRHRGTVRLSGVVANVQKLTNATFAGLLADGLMAEEFECLTELSPEAARALSSRATSLSFPKLKTLTCLQAEQLIKTKYVLRLNGVESLQQDVAEILALSRNNAPDLWLGGLAELSVAAAEALGGKRGALGLDGLTKLNPQIASNLARHDGGPLFLRGVASLDEQTARALSMHESWIHLGVKELTVATAKALTHCDSYRGITLTHLRHVEPQVADALVANEKLILQLPALTAQDIRPELSVAFAKAKCKLELPGIVELSPELARDFGFYSSRVTLTNLRKLTPDQARLLAGNTGELEFPLIERLDQETLEQFSSHKGALAFHAASLDAAFLRGLEKHEGVLKIRMPTHFLRRPIADDVGIFLQVEGVVALVRHRGPVVLSNVKWLPDGIVDVLAERRNLFCLPDLSIISKDRLLVLRGNPNIVLPDGLEAE